MERIGGEDVGQPTSINQVALSGLVGATVEWYDFFLYGTAAALVFGQLFFPSSDPLVGTIAAFGSFAFGYLSRPIGAVVFGHYYDKRQHLISHSLPYPQADDGEDGERPERLQHVGHLLAVGGSHSRHSLVCAELGGCRRHKRTLHQPVATTRGDK